MPAKWGGYLAQTGQILRSYHRSPTERKICSASRSEIQNLAFVRSSCRTGSTAGNSPCCLAFATHPRVPVKRIPLATASSRAARSSNNTNEPGCSRASARHSASPSWTLAAKLPTRRRSAGTSMEICRSLWMDAELGNRSALASNSLLTAGGMTKVPYIASKTSIRPMAAKLMIGVVFDMINEPAMRRDCSRLVQSPAHPRVG